MPECPIETGKSSPRRSQRRHAPGRSRPTSGPFASTSARNPADGTGARMRPLTHQIIDCFDHPVQLGSVHRDRRRTAATDRSPARSPGFHRSSLRHSLGRCGGRDRRAHRVRRDGCRAGRARSSCAARRTVSAGLAPATTLDAVPTGHQWTPDIASATSSSTTCAATRGITRRTYHPVTRRRARTPAT